MFSSFSVLIILTIQMINQTDGKLLELKLEESDKQPLLIAKSLKNLNDIYVLPPAADYEGKNIEIYLPKDYTMTFGCPEEDDQQKNIETEYRKQIKEGNEWFYQGSLLFENENTKKQACQKNLRYSYNTTAEKCGNSREGVIIHVGYFVFRIEKLTNKLIKEVIFAPIYEICFSNKSGIVFTKHYLHATKGLNVNESKNHDQEILQNEQDKIKHAMVPKEDMIPIPWKLTTQSDYNQVEINQNTKTYLIRINNEVRRLAVEDPEKPSLRIYAGVKENLQIGNKVYDSKWYWKLIIRRENLIKGIAVIFYDGNSCESPCENNENLCQKSGFSALSDIPCFFCCLIDETFGKTFDLSYDRTSGSEYVIVDGMLDFNKKSKKSKKSKQVGYGDGGYTSNSYTSNPTSSHDSDAGFVGLSIGDMG